VTVPNRIEWEPKTVRFEKFENGVALVIRTNHGPGYVAVPFVNAAHAREFMAYREIELADIEADEVFGA